MRPPADVVRAAAERLTRYLQPGEVVAATDEGLLSLRLHHEDRAARPVRLQEMAYHAIEVLDTLVERDGSSTSGSAGRTSPASRAPSRPSGTPPRRPPSRCGLATCSHGCRRPPAPAGRA